jgi:hypothetical protein
MADHVGDRLLDDTERRQVDVRRKRFPAAEPFHVDLHARVQVMAASWSRSARPGAGPSGACPRPGSRGSARRSPVIIRRSPDSVSLLVVSMAARASRASAGLVSKTRRPEPAWIAMMPMLCATMSCSSRAIRSRSAIALWAAAWARTSSVRAWACRIEFPMSQAMIMARGTAIVMRGTGDPDLPFGSWSGSGNSKTRMGRPAPATATPVSETLRVRVAAM